MGPNAKKMKKADDNKGPNEGCSNNGAGFPSGNNAAGPSFSQGAMVPSGFVYSPKKGLKAMQAAEARQEDTDEDTNMNTDEETKTDWQEVKRAKDRFFAAAVMIDTIHGETTYEKRLELESIMLQVKIHCTEGPTRIKVNDEPAFRVAVETKEDFEKLLAMTVKIEDEQGIEETVGMFKRLDNTQRESELERTVEVYGLPPRIAEFRIISAMNTFGPVEKISTRPCSKGVKITAQVVFNSVDDVLDLKKSGRNHVYVGKDLARLRKIGNEMVTWELKHVAKLSGLPSGTSELDLQSLLGEDKADFVTVPKFYIREGKQMRLQREAFVYFRTEEAMKKMMESPIKIGDIQLHWGDREEKRCRQCGNLGHIMKECNVFKELQKTREHMRAVKEFQRGGALKVTSRKSFAVVAGGNENKDSGNQQPKEQETQKTQGQQQTTAKQSGMDNNITPAQTKQSAAVDKKINQLTETVERLQAEQRQLVQQNSVLLQLVVTMMTQHLGVTIPAEQLVAAGLSADINRNAPKTKNGKSTAVQGLPSTNELLAKVMATIVTVQNTKAEKKKGEGVGATTNNGQSPKSVIFNE